MVKVRVRFSIEKLRWQKACEYAEATNRTPTELICEALEQMQTRYPKRPRCTETELDVLAAKVASKLSLQVPAGTSGGKS